MAVVLGLWQWRQLQLAEFSPTHPMSSYVVNSACGTSSSEEFGCSDLEPLQNICIYRLSPIAEPRSSLPAWHAAANLVWNQNKERLFHLCPHIILDVCFIFTYFIKYMSQQLAGFTKWREQLIGEIYRNAFFNWQNQMRPNSDKQTFTWVGWFFYCKFVLNKIIWNIKLQLHLFYCAVGNQPPPACTLLSSQTVFSCLI